jgi:hypothetical protein
LYELRGAFEKQAVAIQKTRNIRKFGSQMGPGVPEPKENKKVSFFKKQLCLEKIWFGKPKFPLPPIFYMFFSKEKYDTFV